MNDVRLKHLGFVRILAIYAAMVLSNLYEYAKRNSGPLKSTIGKVEEAVTAVVGPAYDKFKDVPIDILAFIDKKVDEATYKFDKCAPSAAKNAVLKVHSVVNKASEVVQDLTEEAKVDGPLAAISHAANISKDVVVGQMAVVWYKANQYPALHGVLEIAFPTARHWSEKYNSLVNDLTAKGYGFLSFVPLVPVEELVKAYKQVEGAASKTADTSNSSENGSDKE